MTTIHTDTNRDREVPRDETAFLIASDKVEGTAVYGPDADKIGRIENLMIDKMSGRVAYAVLTFGGFLGMGNDYYPLPWSMLKYDEGLGGYIVNLTRDQLESAPKYRESDNWDWSNRRELGQIDEHYRPFAFI
jgi:PRC-barrel domain protein